MTLRPLGEGDLFGAAEVREDEPVVETCEDIYYLPYSPWGRWGVFDHDDRIVEASVDYMLPESVPVMQILESDRVCAEVTEVAPEAEYVYAGRLASHYGHFLVESLPRYWPLLRGPEPRKLLVHEAPGEDLFAAEPFATIFAALGVGREAVVSFDRPVRIPRLVLPHTSLRQNVWGHRAFEQLCRRVGAAVLDREHRVDPRPAYLSKTRLGGGLRRIVNEAEIESVLAAEGVEIVHPETLPFPEQLALFATRRTILGTAGSAFHTSLLVRPAGRSIVLSPRPSINSNYWLFDRLGGTRTSYWFAEGTELVEDDRFLRGFHVPDPEGAARGLLALI